MDGTSTEEATTQSCAEDDNGAEAEEETQRQRNLRYPLRQEAYEEFRDRELEIQRRERDIMQWELEILCREREAEVDARLMASPMITASQSSTMRLQPKALSELLSEFSGTEDTFGVWKKQFELIRTTYQLDDGMARILIGMRLKQKAL